MYRKISILVIGIALLLFTASAQAATGSFSFNVTYGNAANGGSGWPYAEFNINYNPTYQGVTNTFGYCAEYDESINSIYTYKFTSRNDLTLAEYKSAWLMEKYAYGSVDGDKVLSKADDNTITALQASIWSVLGVEDISWTPITASSDSAIYNLYSSMMAETILGFTDISYFKNLGLDLKYQILQPNREGTDAQNLIVRTNVVPIPGAAFLLAPVLIGIVGFRKKFSA